MSAECYCVTTAIYCAVIEVLEFFAWCAIAKESFFLLIYPALSIPMHCFYVIQANMGGEVVGIFHLTERLSARFNGDKRGEVEPLEKGGNRLKAGVVEQRSVLPDSEWNKDIFQGFALAGNLKF